MSYASKWKLQLISPSGEVVCFKNWYSASTTPAQSWALGIVYRYLVGEYIAGRLCIGDYPVLHGSDMLLRKDSWTFHDYRITWSATHPNDPNPFLGSGGDAFILWKNCDGRYVEIFRDSLPDGFLCLDTEQQYRALEDLDDIPDFEMPGAVLIN